MTSVTKASVSYSRWKCGNTSDVTTLTKLPHSAVRIWRLRISLVACRLLIFKAIVTNTENEMWREAWEHCDIRLSECCAVTGEQDWLCGRRGKCNQITQVIFYILTVYLVTVMKTERWLLWHSRVMSNMWVDCGLMGKVLLLWVVGESPTNCLYSFPSIILSLYLSILLSFHYYIDIYFISIQCCITCFINFCCNVINLMIPISISLRNLSF